jgi:hypothetical protein
MKIPAYWAREIVTETDRRGNIISIPLWRSSDQSQEEQFQQWLAGYTKRQAGYATCRCLGEVGSGNVHPEIQPVIEVHDRMTRCNEPLNLA